MAAAPPTSAKARIGQPPRSVRETPTANAQANAATPSHSTPSPIGGRSAGLNTRSVPIRESKYSLNASTPTTASTTPARPLQNAGASNAPAMAYAQAAPRRYGRRPAYRENTLGASGETTGEREAH